MKAYLAPPCNQNFFLFVAIAAIKFRIFTREIIVPNVSITTRFKTTKQAYVIIFPHFRLLYCPNYGIYFSFNIVTTVALQLTKFEFSAFSSENNTNGTARLKRYLLRFAILCSLIAKISITFLLLKFFIITEHKWENSYKP